jgi:glycosyltransferase involved in cell wall biosynthesis
MKKILLIGQFPPPIHGLSVALQTIVNSKIINESYSIDVLDIKENRKFFRHLYNLIRKDADMFYFTISQSTFGNIRDLVILFFLVCKRKKIIIHYHGGYYKILFNKMNKVQKKLNQLLISKINTMISLSESLKGIFNDVIDYEKITVCENFISETSLSSEKEFNKKIARLGEKPVLDILYLSNFIKTKGYLDVLETAKDLREKPVTFHFAGAFFNEKDREEFFQILKENRIEDKVEYHGIVGGDQKKNLLVKSDVFVLPTYYPNEGQPISIIEAMGNGLTILSTAHAGIPDLIKEENGFLVSPKSPKEISYHIEQLLINKEKLTFFAINNRETVLSKYKEEHYIQRIDCIFKEVLEL